MGASCSQVPDESLEGTEGHRLTSARGYCLESGVGALLPLPVIGFRLRLAARFGLQLLDLASLLGCLAKEEVPLCQFQDWLLP